MMGFFSSLLGSSAYKDDEEAINAIIDVACFGIGVSNNRDKGTMEQTLNAVERYIAPRTSARLFYWLGIGWRNYTAWHVKGEQKKDTLTKAISYFKQALEKASSELPILLPPGKRHNSAYLDQVSIASDLALLLMDYKVRDFEEAEKILKFVYDNTDDYEPCFCSYIELFLDRDENDVAANIAIDVLKRTQRKQSEWKQVPPGFLADATMAFRRMGEDAKNKGDTAQALEWYQRIQEMNVATDDDKKTLKALAGVK